MNACYVIDAVRTPIGRYGGKLSSIRPDDLLAHVITSLLERNNTIDPAATFSNASLQIFVSGNTTIGSCWVYVFADGAWNYMNLYQP